MAVRRAPGKVNFPDSHFFGSCFHRSHGFTMVEIIMVLLIMGILGVLTFSTVQSNSDAREVAMEAATLRSHLRYAVLASISGDDLYRVTFQTSPPSYQIDSLRGTMVRSLNFSSSTPQVTLKNGVGISVTGSSGNMVAFDHLGRPSQNLPANSLDKNDVRNMSKYSNDIVVTLSKNGHSENVTITRGTGYIQ